MSLIVLGTDQDDQWRDWIWELPTELRDIHWHPDLFRAYELVYGYTAQLVISHEGSQFAAIPVLRNGTEMLHCFNFGGPVGSACVGLAWDLVDWKRREGITHERCTLHPLVQDNQRAILEKSPFTPEYVKDAVYIDLTKPIELRETHRQMVRKANESNCTVVRAIADSRTLNIFSAMYSATMVRLGAAEHWKFHAEYFNILADRLGERMSIFLAYVGNELEAACVVLHDNDTAYYHYAASVWTHRKIGVNHAMIVACADWARAAGYKKLFLGGGVEPEDGLFLFKSGFSKDRAPVYRYEVTT